MAVIIQELSIKTKIIDMASCDNNQSKNIKILNDEINRIKHKIHKINTIINEKDIYQR